MTEPEAKGTPDRELEMEMGVQPVDALLSSHNIANHEVVAAIAGTGLTHKVVAKARRGRQLTGKAQRKVLAAVCAAFKAREIPAPALADLFNYRGRA